MKVALLNHQFFPDYYTGVERLTLNLAQQFMRMGHEAVVVTASASDTSYEFEGVRVRPLSAWRSDLAQPWLSAASSQVALTRLLREEEIDLIDVMQPMRLPSVFACARELTLPVVVHIADFFYVCPRITMLRVGGARCIDADDGHQCVSVCGIASGPDRLNWSRGTLAAADAVVAPCEFTIEAYASQGFDTRGWHHVPWGVDYAMHPERLPPQASRNRLRVAFLGTLVPHKGAHILVEAASRVRDPRLEVMIYGESFHEARYEADLRRAAAEDPRIAFAGAYAHNHFRRVLADIDAVVIPSLWHENLPTSGLNAVAAGVPLVVSDVGGLRPLVEDYRAGFAFRAGDAGSLAAVFTELLNEPDRLSHVRAQLPYPPGIEEEALQLETIYAAVQGGVAPWSATR